MMYALNTCPLETEAWCQFRRLQQCGLTLLRSAPIVMIADGSSLPEAEVEMMTSFKPSTDS